MRLENRAAIVTGGASGIGRAICELFAEEGAKVVVEDIDAEGSQETVRRITSSGGDALAVKTDVSREEDVRGLVEQTSASYGTEYSGSTSWGLPTASSRS